ncbi:MAG: hypothetical protein QNI97_10150 [Desulfobacterales bacterium]|nr:hypothetical protein [Desulfobacterales bacterium]
MLGAFFKTAQDFAEGIRRLRAADRAVALDHERWRGRKSIGPGHSGGVLKTGQIGASLKGGIQRDRIESHLCGQFQDNRSITDVPAFREKCPENGLVKGVIFSMLFRELTALHRHTGVAHERLRSETDAQLLAALIELLKKAFRIHAGKVIFPEDTLRRRIRVDFERQPLLVDDEFFFKFFDNTFADIAERSDIVGIDRDADGCHLIFSMDRVSVCPMPFTCREILSML